MNIAVWNGGLRRFAASALLVAMTAAAWASEEAAHGAEHAEPSLFAGGIGNAVVTLIIFGIVVFMLGKFAWPNVLRVLQDRENAIHQALEDAKRERDQAKKLLADYEQKLVEARAEATAIVEEGRRDRQELLRRSETDAQARADELVARAKREIQISTEAAVRTLYDQTAELAVQVAGQIVRKELNASDHQQLVAESLERMKAQSN